MTSSVTVAVPGGDLDVLAFRFPDAGCATSHARGRRVHGSVTLAVDPALGAEPEIADMIVGEVKEGAARFNPGARDPLVIAAALSRFGCCPLETAEATARALLTRGRARTSSGHVVRMVAFGGQVSAAETRWHTVSLGHVVSFVRGELHRRWPDLRHVELKHPALALLALLEKVGTDP